MEIGDIRQVLQWLEAAGLESIEIDGPGLRLRIARGGHASSGRGLTVSVTPDGLADAPAGHKVTARVAGVFRLRHPYAARPIVELGASVAAGAVIGLLQIGTIYAPVTARVAGIVGRLSAVPDSLVGYGTPLFEIFDLPSGD
ncbi:MAG: hypothetical protein JNK67_04710 [Alphaproteobacteria bacterium]|nr:hypothetical protein [Alphaproteobacteria bacterium]